MASSNDNKSDHSSEPTPAQSGKVPTARGSKLGNKNAFVHGFHSKYVVLPWESEDDFKELLEDFRHEWKPDGPSEELAVWDLAHNTWLKLRVLASTQLQLSQSALPEEVKRGELTLEKMLQHQAKVPKQASGTLASINVFIKELEDVFATIRSRKWPETEDGRQVRDALHIQKGDLSTLIEKTKETVLGGVNQLVEVLRRSAARFEQAYQPDEIDKQLDHLAKLDARTEKILRRLTALKEYKRVAKSYNDPSTVVESPSLVPGETTTADTSSRGQ